MSKRCVQKLTEKLISRKSVWQNWKRRKRKNVKKRKKER